MLLASLGVAAAIVVFRIVGRRERGSLMSTLAISVLTGAGFTGVFLLVSIVLSLYGVGDIETRETSRTVDLVKVDGRWYSRLTDVGGKSAGVEFWIMNSFGMVEEVCATSGNSTLLVSPSDQGGVVHIRSVEQRTVFTYPFPLTAESYYQIYVPE